MAEAANLFKDMGPTKLAIMAIVGVIILFSIVFIGMNLSKPAVVPLFSGLNSDDSTKISAKLESMGIYYELQSGGAQIMVPHNKVLAIRMKLAENGLPSGRANIGYEIFDKSDAMGVSSFVNNVNLLRALEGELSRTISAFDHIESARVHLVIPKQDLFSKRKQEPTASVILKMRGNQPLSRSQISAISHLVATAVPKLSIKRITIVDTQGRPFKKGADDDNDSGIIASNNEEFRIQYERRIKDTIETLLSRSVGAGSIEAQVSAEIDFDKVISNSEIFDPEGAVPRSVQTIEERENSSDGTIGGDVSVVNNLPSGEANTNNSGSKSNTERIDEVTNFEISKTVTQHVRETGNVKKLSIAVLVDGIYSEDEETGEQIYTPRNDEELKSLEELVKSAVGFNAERGDSVKIVNMKFSNEIQGLEPPEKFDWITRDLGSIIQTLIIGVIITLVILLVIKPMMKRAFEVTKSESDEVELQAALAGDDLDELATITGQTEEVAKKGSLIDMEKFEANVNSESVMAVNDIVERHPNEVTTILRGWMEADSS